MRTEDMRNMIVAAGGSVDDLPDNLPSTLQKRLIETMGGECPEGNLPSDICNAFGSCGDAQNVVFGEVSGEMATTATAFASYITELVLPEGATSTKNSGGEGYDGIMGFDDFVNVRKITVPASLVENDDCILGDLHTTNTGGLASNADGLEVVIAHGATKIAYEAFCYGGRITKITIPNTVKTIEGYAIANTSITEITIPASVETMAENALGENNSLARITVNKPENSIAGAPWGAENAEVIWTG